MVLKLHHISLIMVINYNWMQLVNTFMLVEQGKWKCLVHDDCRCWLNNTSVWVT